MDYYRLLLDHFWTEGQYVIIPLAVHLFDYWQPIEPMSHEDLTPTERAFLIGVHMAAEHCITNAQLMRSFGLSASGAYRLMTRLSRIAPMVRDNGDWRLLHAESRETSLPASGLPGADD